MARGGARNLTWRGFFILFLRAARVAAGRLLR
jgi:hypothetical protein